MMNFVPFIYQEPQNIENNKLLIFDIIYNEIPVSLSCNPSQKNQKYLYEDDQ